MPDDEKNLVMDPLPDLRFLAGGGPDKSSLARRRAISRSAASCSRLACAMSDSLREALGFPCSEETNMAFGARFGRAWSPRGVVCGVDGWTAAVVQSPGGSP